ncbi:hypothetical protein S40293_10831 [Stachybotrys chartarum IBT 40293]|nr:hypothetical protein S40293_10831 [Stachybotrys chartarum IBT 40293]
MFCSAQWLGPASRLVGGPGRYPVASRIPTPNEIPCPLWVPDEDDKLFATAPHAQAEPTVALIRGDRFRDVPGGDTHQPEEAEWDLRRPTTTLIELIPGVLKPEKPPPAHRNPALSPPNGLGAGGQSRDHTRTDSAYALSSWLPPRKILVNPWTDEELDGGRAELEKLLSNHLQIQNLVTSKASP